MPEECLSLLRTTWITIIPCFSEDRFSSMGYWCRIGSRHSIFCVLILKGSSLKWSFDFERKVEEPQPQSYLRRQPKLRVCSSANVYYTHIQLLWESGIKETLKQLLRWGDQSFCFQVASSHIIFWFYPWTRASLNSTVDFPLSLACDVWKGWWVQTALFWV